MTTEPLRSQRAEPAVFIKIGLADGPIRVWTGVNDRRGGPGDEDLDEDGLMPLYLGRRLHGAPELMQLPNAKAHRIEIALSGTDGALAALLDERAAEVPDAEVIIAFGVMQDGAKHPDVAWPLWRVRYLADSVGFRFQNEVPVVVLSAATWSIRRKRPVNAYWTHQDQYRRHTGDLALDRIAAMNEGRTRIFKGT